MRIITTVFGKEYIGMLISNLYSISKSNPIADVTVIWEDIPDKYICPVKKCFKNYEFIETKIGFTKDPAKRIASKTILWQMGVDRYPGELLALIDVDTLIIKDITHFFEEFNYDIIYTYKNEQFPLNTGVLLCNNSTKTRLFFKKWKEETFGIFKKPDLLIQATNSSFPYGAVDQMAFYRVIVYKHNSTKYCVNLGSHKVKLLGIPCKTLNETNSTAITKENHIIHYKGGWQNILIKGLNFTKKRPKKLSWEMFILYLKTYSGAVNHINKKTKMNYPIDFFKIKIPYYIDRDKFEEKKLLYYLFSIIGLVRKILQKTDYIFKKVVKNNKY